MLRTGVSKRFSPLTARELKLGDRGDGGDEQRLFPSVGDTAQMFRLTVKCNDSLMVNLQTFF